MAIIGCHEVDSYGDTDEQGNRTYTRVFNVLTDDRLDGPKIVKAAPGIAWGAKYITTNESDLHAYARHFDAKRFQTKDSKVFWLLTITYTSQPWTSNTGLTAPGSPPSPQADTAPNLRTPTVDYGTHLVKTVMWRDQGPTHKKVASSNGLRYGTPLEAEHVCPTITITTWKDPASYNVLSQQRTYVNSVNDATWNGIGLGEAKCVNLTGKLQYEQEAWWLQVTLTVHVAAGTMLCYVDYPGNLELATPEVSWDTEVLNTGLKELVGTEHRTILDKFNKQVSEPFPLDFNGTKLSIPAYPTDPSYTYKRYRRNPRKDWSTII